MSIRYYIKSELVIEYKDKIGRKCEIYTDMKMDRVYIYRCEHENDTNIEENLKKELEKNTYNIIIFENDSWVKKRYRKLYNKRISREFKEIEQIIKIYKKVTAF